MGVLILGLMVIGFIYLVLFNFRLLLGIIGGILLLGFAWALGWGVLLALISAIA